MPTCSKSPTETVVSAETVARIAVEGLLPLGPTKIAAADIDFWLYRLYTQYTHGQTAAVLPDHPAAYGYLRGRDLGRVVVAKQASRRHCGPPHPNRKPAHGSRQAHCRIGEQ